MVFLVECGVVRNLQYLIWQETSNPEPFHLKRSSPGCFSDNHIFLQTGRVMWKVPGAQSQLPMVRKQKSIVKNWKLNLWVKPAHDRMKLPFWGMSPVPELPKRNLWYWGGGLTSSGPPVPASSRIEPSFLSPQIFDKIILTPEVRKVLSFTDPAGMTAFQVVLNLTHFLEWILNTLVLLSHGS